MTAAAPRATEEPWHEAFGQAPPARLASAACAARVTPQSPAARSRFSSCGRLCGRCISGPAGNGSKPPAASAVPSFARQTGQPCATCHTVFPELTPFERRFKLGGYTAGGGLTFEEAPPIAAMLQPTFTHTARNQDSEPAPGTSTTNNTILGGGKRVLRRPNLRKSWSIGSDNL
jgi:hypothetical protein